MLNCLSTLFMASQLGALRELSCCRAHLRRVTKSLGRRRNVAVIKADSGRSVANGLGQELSEFSAQQDWLLPHQLRQS